MLMRPRADVTIPQLSILASLDPAQHLLLGKALADVMCEDITLIGSGFSFHNLGVLTRRLAPASANRGGCI